MWRLFQQGTTGVFFWIAPVAFTTKGWGLTFTFARVLFRAQIVGPSLHATDKKKGPHEVCSPCSRAHPLWPCAHRMCHRRETGLSPLAHTCSRRWTLVRRLRIWAHRQKLEIVSPQTFLSFCQCDDACFQPRGAHLAQWCYEKQFGNDFFMCSLCYI